MANERLHPSTQTLIDSLKNAERPRDKQVGQALEEVYASGRFRTAVIRGESNPAQIDVPQTILAIRLVTLNQPNHYESLTVASQPQRSREFLDKLKKDLASVPVNTGLVAPILPLLEELIKSERLIVLAAQSLSRIHRTGKEMGSIIYPKAYRNIPLPIPDNQRDTLGLAMAAGILKFVPFDHHNISIPLPSH